MYVVAGENNELLLQQQVCAGSCGTQEQVSAIDFITHNLVNPTTKGTFEVHSLSLSILYWSISVL